MSEPKVGPTPADPGNTDEGSTTAFLKLFAVDRDRLDDPDDPADDDPAWFDRFADALMDRVARQSAERRARSKRRPR